MEMNVENKVEVTITNQDSNLIVMQMFTKCMGKSEAQSQTTQQQNQMLRSQAEGIVEKIYATAEVNNAGGANKSLTNCCHPKKIEWGLDYA